MVVTDTSSPVQGGLRERNRQAKLTRIRRAASDVFLARGYDATTTREIAERADVAFGTLFLYAHDKADLLLMVFEEPYEAMASRAFDRLNDGSTFVDRLVGLFDDFFAFFAATPDLSRRMLRESTFAKNGPSGTFRKAALRQSASRLERFVASEQDAGRIGRGTTARDLAELVFLIYRSDLRTFLNDDPPDLVAGLAQLRKHLQILTAGLTRSASATTEAP